jgi:hypothetical protein
MHNLPDRNSDKHGNIKNKNFKCIPVEYGKYLKEEIDIFHM